MLIFIQTQEYSAEEFSATHALVGFAVILEASRARNVTRPLKAFAASSPKSGNNSGMSESEAKHSSATSTPKSVLPAGVTEAVFGSTTMKKAKNTVVPI